MTTEVTLAQHLAALSDEGLATLLRHRPDLAVPAAASSSVLAHRSAFRGSLSTALDSLDAWHLANLDVLAALGADREPVAEAELLAALGGIAEPPAAAARASGSRSAATARAGAIRAAVTSALDALKSMALIWESDGLVMVPGIAELPLRWAGAGLGRFSAALIGVDIAGVVAEATDNERALLESLSGDSPYGRTRDAAPDSPADSPVQRLLRAGLLLAVDGLTVELPLQVGAYFRDPERPLRVSTVLPELAGDSLGGSPIDAAAIDASAAGEIVEVLRESQLLLESLAAQPAPVLRAGGIGVRELKRITKATGLSTERTGFLLEVLWAADLVGSDGAALAPTSAYDPWFAADRPTRWAALAAPWLLAERLPGRIGQPADGSVSPAAGVKTVVPLSPEAARAGAHTDRLIALEALTAVPDGTPLTAAGAHEILAWLRPRWIGAHARRMVAWTLREAESLGVTAHGALSSPGRTLWRQYAGAADIGTDRASRERELAVAVAAALPAEIEHFLLQADLTVVAPGLLRREVEERLALLADIESAGAATVYRITEGTLRRALDVGLSAAEVREFLGAHSRTPVPQSLSYLIDDVARRHGQLRVGSASSFVRCEDDALLSEVITRIGSTGSNSHGLRRIAPGVAICDSEPDELLRILRAGGFAPAGENSSGGIVDLAPRGIRTRTRRGHRPPQRPGRLTDAQLAQAITILRSGDRAATVATVTPIRADGSRTAGLATIAMLNAAAGRRSGVVVEYVDAQGISASRLLEPIAVTAGTLEAFDPASNTVRHLPLHRVIAVATATGD